MKYFIFYTIWGSMLLYLMLRPQVAYSQDGIRAENRKVDDPIYETGDTLYLFYDCTDSLQAYYDRGYFKIVLWKIREMTREESEQPDPPEYDGLFFSKKWHEFYLYGIHGYEPEIWTFEDLEGIILTSRKELLDFYQREYVRKKGKVKESGKEMRMCLSEYDFGNHFTYIYMLIPRSDGKFELYAIRVEGRFDFQKGKS